MRHIDDNIWRDEWFAEQEDLARLLWLGIVTKTADDRGRLIDNAALIKSDIFPLSKVEYPFIEMTVTKFVAAGKLRRYEDGGKKRLEVVEWWKYGFTGREKERTCSLCGYEGPAIDQHHIHGRKNSDETIQICCNCHREIHRGARKI